MLKSTSSMLESTFGSGSGVGGFSGVGSLGVGGVLGSDGSGVTVSGGRSGRWFLPRLSWLRICSQLMVWSANFTFFIGSGSSMIF